MGDRGGGAMTCYAMRQLPKSRPLRKLHAPLSSPPSFFGGPVFVLPGGLFGRQVAANEAGIKELHKMVAHFGIETVTAYMGHVQVPSSAPSYFPVSSSSSSSSSFLLLLLLLLFFVVV